MQIKKVVLDNQEYEIVDENLSCIKCGSDDLYLRKNSIHIELRCKNCGTLVKFVTQAKNAREQWTKEVKVRDRYTCQRCKRVLSPNKADAHHKLPVWFMPELELDNTNGICLCKECHKALHGKGGTINDK